MGKRIRVQRRGRGGRNFRASTHKRVAPAKYPAIAPKEAFEAQLNGIIEDLVHDPGRLTVWTNGAIEKLSTLHGEKA